MSETRSVFISFSPADRAAAERIHTGLANRGYATWIAPAELSTEDPHAAIVRVIGASTDMVLVFSAATNASEDARRELALAAQHHLTIVPVKIEAVTPNDHFAYELATSRWIDATQDFDGALNQIAAAIGASGIAAAPAPQPVAPPPQPVATPQPVAAAPVQPQVVYASYPVSAPKSHVLRHVILTIVVLLVLIVGGFFAWVYFGFMPKAKQLAAEDQACIQATAADTIVATCSTAISDPANLDERSRAVPRTRRGVGYLMKKDYASALADFTTVIDLGNATPRDYYLRSVAQRGLGNATAADADVAKSAGYSPSADERALEPVAVAPPVSPAPVDTTPPETTPAPDATPPAPDANPAPDQPAPDTTTPDQPAPDQTPPQDDSGNQTSGETRSHN